ncbi:phage tail assembly protein [Porphyrobacter sp. YT40]|uniref:phage tail assembly protein n=1 Tax=Porphyrobacter sp. YT40 TaxID=2547601 RepID=UPI0011438280|nr:phage tail assembly protein [Porphyrobacter sp. YT40]QDH35854.1 phage tail assembly protein [Porphyrobacter sp. YT40]
MRPLAHTLVHPIIAETRPAGSTEVIEEELKPAGHTVVMRRPKAKDMRAFDKHGDAGIAAIIDLIVACSHLSLIEVENLDAEDFEALGNLLEPKRTAGLQTGSSA